MQKLPISICSINGHPTEVNGMKKPSSTSRCLHVYLCLVSYSYPCVDGHLATGGRADVGTELAHKQMEIRFECCDDAITCENSCSTSKINGSDKPATSTQSNCRFNRHSRHVTDITETSISLLCSSVTRLTQA